MSDTPAKLERPSHDSTRRARIWATHSVWADPKAHSAPRVSEAENRPTAPAPNVRPAGKKVVHLGAWTGSSSTRWDLTQACRESGSLGVVLVPVREAVTCNACKGCRE